MGSAGPEKEMHGSGCHSLCETSAVHQSSYVSKCRDQPMIDGRRLLAHGLLMEQAPQRILLPRKAQGHTGQIQTLSPVDKTIFEKPW
jgi:hypothetical protein